MTMDFIERLKPLYDITLLQGYEEEEIRYLKQLFGALPKVLEEYYRTAGKTKAFHCVQDEWMLPEHFQKWKWLQDSDCMILLNENQGVCRAGIKRADLHLADPPVYCSHDDKTWKLCAPSTSEFLAAALAYEAVFVMEYSPEEFYELTKEELALLESQLTKYPFEMQNWIGDMKISLYGNAADNIAAVMRCEEEDLQMLYGAASEPSYKKLSAVLDGIGEPL